MCFNVANNGATSKVSIFAQLLENAPLPMKESKPMETIINLSKPHSGIQPLPRAILNTELSIVPTTPNTRSVTEK